MLNVQIGRCLRLKSVCDSEAELCGTVVLLWKRKNERNNCACGKLESERGVVIKRGMGNVGRGEVQVPRADVYGVASIKEKEKVVAFGFIRISRNFSVYLSINLCLFAFKTHKGSQRLPHTLFGSL